MDCARTDEVRRIEISRWHPDAEDMLDFHRHGNQRHGIEHPVLKKIRFPLQFLSRPSGHADLDQDVAQLFYELLGIRHADRFGFIAHFLVTSLWDFPRKVQGASPTVGR